MFLMRKLKLNVAPGTAATDMTDVEEDLSFLTKVTQYVVPLKLLLPELSHQLISSVPVSGVWQNKKQTNTKK